MTKYKSIVLNVPHASIEGLSDSNWVLGSEFFSHVKKWTDWYTDYLFSSNRPCIKMARASLSPECPFLYHSIMVELNKRIYMNEETIELTPEHIKVKACIEEIYDKLLPSENTSFSTKSTQDLVDSFNSQVGCRGWSSARAIHNTSLIKEFIHRGIDVSTVYDGQSISFLHHVVLNEEATKLVIIL